MKSDKEIRDIVIQKLLWDARVSPARIDVNVKNGTATMSGTVDNFYKKWSAIDTVCKIPDVVEVKDHLNVKPSDFVDDISLQKNIKTTLENDSRLETCDVFCIVENGTVFLRGDVHSYYQKIAAEESCRWVKGVIKVENQIKVIARGKHHDEQIKRKIREIIQQNIREDMSGINIQVENGIVLLSGQVNKISAKVYAETLASLVANVSYIQNEIDISPN